MILALVAAAAALGMAAEAGPYDSELRPMIDGYAADLAAIERTYPFELSATRHARLERLAAERETELRKVEFAPLSRNGQIDYLLLRNALDRLRAQVQLERRRAVELEPLLPFASTIVNLEEARRRMAPVNAPAAAQQLADLAKAVRAIAAARPAAKPAVVNRAARQLKALREALQAWHAFYDGYDPSFSWWTAEPYKQASQALENYGKLLESAPAPLVGDPVGRESLLEYLYYNMIPYSPEELLALARKELAWGEEQMRAAARELGFGEDWRRALEAVKNKYVEPGQQPQLVRRLAEEAIDFVTSRDLVTVPPLAREDWWEEMLSPERQLTSPFFLGGDLILVAYPTSGMTHEQKLMSLRGNNEHFARAVVFHELIPGHHLQGFMNERHRKYRQIFATPFWSEGNAFYWELVLWDLGFPRGPEDRIGMLFWRMHRAARVLFSISFHLEQMTAEQCVEFLVERVGHERANAEAEVRRSIDGSYEPIYQSAYLLGALQFYALRRELVLTRRMSEREFHDAILEQNSIPVELVRAALTGQPLTPDYRASWRFYDLPAN
jgi:uncharacterized protein (DUF885 family)